MVPGKPKFKRARRIKLIPGYLFSLAQANKHKIKVFRLLDAENQKLDQMELFN